MITSSKIFWIFGGIIIVLSIVEGILVKDEYNSFTINNEIRFYENTYRRIFRKLGTIIFIGVVVTLSFNVDYVLISIILLSASTILVYILVKNNKPLFIIEKETVSISIEHNFISLPEIAEIQFIEDRVSENTYYRIVLITQNEISHQLFAYENEKRAYSRFVKLKELLKVPTVHIIDRGFPGQKIVE